MSNTKWAEVESSVLPDGGIRFTHPRMDLGPAGIVYELIFDFRGRRKGETQAAHNAAAQLAFTRALRSHLARCGVRFERPGKGER